MNYNFALFSIVLYSYVCNGSLHRKKRRLHSNMEGYIVKGVEIDIEQFPWLAHIMIMGQMHCGGVIISNRVILTAAHCLHDWLHLPEIFTIHLGSRHAGKGSVYCPCKFYIHNKYDDESHHPYYYDIGLILLNKTITFNRRVRIARLIPPDKDFKNEHFTMAVAGWGYTSSYGKPSDVLKMTRMRYVSRRRCNGTQTSDGESMPVPNHMFCLIADKWTSDCFGDSGSGVMWGNYVVGIVVTGRDSACGSETMPSMYSDMSYFRSWIKTHAHNLQNKAAGYCKRNCKRKIKSINKSKKEELNIGNSFESQRKYNKVIHDTGNDKQFDWLSVGLMPRVGRQSKGNYINRIKIQLKIDST